jgi:hypothetical protein
MGAFKKFFDKKEQDLCPKSLLKGLLAICQDHVVPEDLLTLGTKLETPRTKLTQ